MRTVQVSINGASSGKGGKARNRVSAKAAAAGQRPGRLPEDLSSPGSATDESGRFEKQQHKRARRRKRGKSAVAGKTAVVTQPDPASQAPATRYVAAPATSHETVTENQPPKKLSNRRRRSRRKKQPTAALLSDGQKSNPVISTSAVNTAISAQATALSKDPSVTYSGEVKSHGFKRARTQNTTSAHRTATPRSLPAENDRDGNRYANVPLYAALDLGTNNCRLLIATPGRPGQFRVVDSFSRIVRLGEGFVSSGQLSDQAMHRAIEALKICRDKLSSKNIRRMRLIATEACRSALNGEYFLQRVRNETGLELEIVDRQTEASLAVSGCGTLVSRDTDALVLFDIGGGSSEIALIDVTSRRSSRLAEHITAWTSLPVGVVTLAEKFGGRDVTIENYSEMVDYVSQLLHSFNDRNKLGALAKSAHFHLLGTSGTVTTLAGIHLGLERYDRRRVDGMWMGAQDVTDMTAKLLSWDFNARVANPCIGADRADLVLAGCAILDAIRRIWPSEKLLVADRGLREGILTELMSRDGAWRNRRNNYTRGRQNK